MISVFIVDDHEMILEGLVALLKNEKDISVAGTATMAIGCLEFLETHTVDVVVTDINMPGLSGIELCKKIKASNPAIQVIALSNYNEGSHIVKMLENGASGYLLKNATRVEIRNAITTVYNHQQYLPDEVQKTYRNSLALKERLPILTKREKEILQLITDGFTNPQISEQLFISIDTVDTHRKNLHSKLQVRNTAQLIRTALDNKLLD